MNHLVPLISEQKQKVGRKKISVLGGDAQEPHKTRIDTQPADSRAISSLKNLESTRESNDKNPVPGLHSARGREAKGKLEENSREKKQGKLKSQGQPVFLLIRLVQELKRGEREKKK